MLDAKEPAPVNIVRKAHTGTKMALQSTSQALHLLTYQIRLLPDFLIIGGQRCGTTSLYEYLKGCPQIFPSFTKEVHFFDEQYARGERWYRAQFPTVLEKYVTSEIKQQKFITGEASPYYIFHPHAAKRVKEMLPRVKLIALLRNPVDRAFSNHWLKVDSGQEKLSFRDAVFAEQERTAGEKEKMLADEDYQSINYPRFSYLARGIYVDQLQHWMQFFPREQFLILRSEDMFVDPAAVVAQTLAFLGVPETKGAIQQEYRQYRLPYDEGHKVKARTSKMDDDLRAYLVDYFRPHNARLYEFLGRDFHWDK
jgi:hypothetical protein